MGQLSVLLRNKFLLDIDSYTKIQGQPFKSSELEEKFANVLGGMSNG